MFQKDQNPPPNPLYIPISGTLLVHNNAASSLNQLIFFELTISSVTEREFNSIDMEKFNFVRDGVIRLPLGFRFQPTDEELVFQYLKCKVFSRPLPASIIPEIHVSKYDPWDLPGDLEQEKYFFSNKEAKYQIGNRSNRATSSGYWKASGTDKQITSSRNSQLVGMKKTLVFYRGKPPYDSRTDWVMHEYRLLSAGAPQPKNTPSSSSIQMEDWVLCRVFLKRRTRADREATESCSSGITEVSSSESEHEESSSTAGYNFFH